METVRQGEGTQAEESTSRRLGLGVLVGVAVVVAALAFAAFLALGAGGARRDQGSPSNAQGKREPQLESVVLGELTSMFGEQVTSVKARRSMPQDLRLEVATVLPGDPESVTAALEIAGAALSIEPVASTIESGSVTALVFPQGGDDYLAGSLLKRSAESSRAIVKSFVGRPFRPGTVSK